jgi:DnaK suppressor protein
VDAAQDQEEEMVWLAVLDRSRDLRDTAEEALRRLATGEYGLCADCGQPISLARLRALPFAIRCLSCQERLEREAKGVGCAVRETRIRHGAALHG